VARLRRAVADDVAGAQLARALDGIRRKGYDIGGEQVTRVPSGFDKGHQRAELLRYKTLTAARDLGCPEWLPTPKARTEIVRAWRGLRPLTTWLDTHVGHD
jgi:hypothetical protein